MTVLSCMYIWSCSDNKEVVVIEKKAEIIKLEIILLNQVYVGSISNDREQVVFEVRDIIIPSVVSISKIETSEGATTSLGNKKELSITRNEGVIDVVSSDKKVKKSYTIIINKINQNQNQNTPPSITKVVLRIDTHNYSGIISDTTFNFRIPVGSTIPSVASLFEVVSSTDSSTSPAQGENITFTNGSATLVAQATNGTSKSYTLNIIVTQAINTPSITKIVLRIGNVNYTGVRSDTTFNFNLPIGATLPSTALLSEVVSSTNSTTVPAQGKNITLTNGQASIILSSTGSSDKTYTISVSIQSNLSQIKLHNSYQNVVQYLMGTIEYNDWIMNNAFNQDAKLKPLVKKIYKDFNDAFDFIFLVMNEENLPSGLRYYGQLISVSNNVTGIGNGISVSDNTADYGSSGKLKSIMILTTKEGISRGPSLHELAHTWANFAITTTDVDNTANQSNYDARPHWGFTGGNDFGQLGGFKQSTLETNVDGNSNKYRVKGFGGFANNGNSYPYTELELYLMGLIPVSEVSSFDVFSGISSVVYDRETDKTTFVSTTKKRYGSAEILSDCGGARNPSSANSQKEFRLITLILTNTALSDTEFSYFNNDLIEFTKKSNSVGINNYNFWRATGGRASLNSGNLASEKK